MSERRKPGLGRGLAALMDDVGAPPAASTQTIPLAQIAPNPRQPRRRFDPEPLAELARSIAERGVLQPIIVRPVGRDRYEIVAGERRWRAAQQVPLHEIPAVIREFGEEETLSVAIVENVQRADLNAIEEAESYSRLVSEFGHTQDAVAKAVGKSRSHVANLIRLLDLPDRVRAMVVDGRLSMGHARAVLGASDPLALAEEVVRRGLSVRETEARAAPRAAVTAPPAQAPRDADVAAIERLVAEVTGLAVSIAHSPQGGSFTLRYRTLDQLDDICKRLSGGRI